MCTSGEKSCDGDKLKTCKADATDFESVTCAEGCAATPTPHCKRVVPSANGVTPADLDGAGLMPIVITASPTINTDTGEISAGIRAANADATKREVVAGIAFHTADIPGVTGKKIGVFSFSSLTIGDGKQVKVVGKNALAIASATEIRILGTLDLRGTCTNAVGGPGGGDGATVGVAAGGDSVGVGKNGNSSSSDGTCGGSGGAYGDNGGSAPSITGTRTGGSPYGKETLVPLLGGSGGGRGGDINPGAASTGGMGGGGGGAGHLVALERIIVGGATALSGINAGGCGGGGAKTPNTNLAGGGGGGGSGGAILLEAPEVKLDIMGNIVANGGAGGGGAMGVSATAADGYPGGVTWNQTQFHGSTASPIASCGKGGFGGATNDTSTDPDSTNKGENAALVSYCGGGGGGGVGRIRVNTKTGVMVVVDATGKVSPKFDDLNSHADKVATQGTVTIE